MKIRNLVLNVLNLRYILHARMEMLRCESDIRINVHARDVNLGVEDSLVPFNIQLKYHLLCEVIHNPTSSRKN